MLILLAHALAWDTVGAVWPGFPVAYEVDANLGDDELAAVQAAFDTWAAVECAGVSFTFGGRASDASWGEADGRNVVFFLEESWPEDASLLSAPALATDGTELLDADIALNGVGYAWALEGADGRITMDLQAAVTHEVGHLLGLWHSTVAGATLDPSMNGNPEARTLEDDDVEGLCALYDGVPGDGVLGDACVETADCGADLVCLADGEDRYCSSSCDASAHCPDGYECLDLGDGEGACAIEAASCGCGGAAPPGAWALVAVLALVTARRSR